MTSITIIYFVCGSNHIDSITDTSAFYIEGIVSMTPLTTYTTIYDTIKFDILKQIIDYDCCRNDKQCTFDSIDIFFDNNKIELDVKKLKFDIDVTTTPFYLHRLIENVI